MITMKKKTFVLIISYLCAAVLILGGYTVFTAQRGENYETTAQNAYRNAFGEVAAAVADLDEALRMGVYATGEELTSALCARAYGDCLAAQMTLSALPFDTVELEETSAFLGRVGDFAYYLCARAADASGFTAAERESMRELSGIAAQLAEMTAALESDIDAGSVIFDDPEDNIKARTAAYMSAEKLSDVLLENENAFPEYSELRYDGKYAFRESASRGELVTENDARKIAAELLQIDEDKLRLDSASQGGSVNYYFSLKLTRDEVYVIVTGDGRVESVTSSRIVSDTNIDESEAETVATEFVKAYVGGEIKRKSAESVNGIYVFSFTPVSGGAAVDAAAISVGIAGDNGGLYSFDASQYLAAEKLNPPADKISRAAAQAALPEGLTVSGGGEAVIKTDSGRAVYCHEFICTDSRGTPVTIYVDAQTGRQAKIVL